jgi:uncharacterized membrane protein YgcG
LIVFVVPVFVVLVFVVLVGSGFSRIAAAQTTALPELTEPVNDFAHVIDPDSAAAIDKMSRALKSASGDVVVVATVPDIDGYGDIREYANKLFENHGKGIGDKAKDNGLLIVLAMKGASTGRVRFTTSNNGLPTGSPARRAAS